MAQKIFRNFRPYPAKTKGGRKEVVFGLFLRDFIQALVHPSEVGQLQKKFSSDQQIRRTLAKKIFRGP